MFHPCSGVFVSACRVRESEDVRPYKQEKDIRSATGAVLLMACEALWWQRSCTAKSIRMTSAVFVRYGGGDTSLFLSFLFFTSTAVYHPANPRPAEACAPMTCIAFLALPCRGAHTFGLPFSPSQDKWKKNREEKGMEMDRQLDVTWSYAIACAEVCIFFLCDLYRSLVSFRPPTRSFEQR